MGYSRKEEIAKLKQERRKAKASQKRREKTREKLVRFLIVCEGEKTEPHYFEALIKNCISTIREVIIEGEGRATVALVDRAKAIKQELERKNAMAFDRVWLVFDKDNFDDFNEAIRKAKKLGFQCAWSNEAFELWYLLHFAYLDTGIGRNAYVEKLQGFFREKMGDTDFEYKKGNPNIYRLLQKRGSEDLAISHANKLRASYEGTDYANHKPCTMVDKLVKELKDPKKLLKE